MQVAATLRYARISPQKCRLMADAIRGKTVDDALRTLTFSPKKSARIVKKVLESAVANAEHNHGADIDELKIATIEVNEAPTFRRYRARAKGRGAVHLLVDLLVVVARLRGECPATADPDRAADRAGASTARAFLAPGLRTAATDGRTILLRLGSGTATGEIGRYDLVHECFVVVHAERRLCDVNGTLVL